MAVSKKVAKTTENTMAQMTALINKARKEGTISATVLTDELEKLDLTVEQIEHVYESFEMMGIQIVGAELELDVDIDAEIDADLQELEEEEDRTGQAIVCGKRN